MWWNLVLLLLFIFPLGSKSFLWANTFFDLLCYILNCCGDDSSFFHDCTRSHYWTWRFCCVFQLLRPRAKKLGLGKFEIVQINFFSWPLTINDGLWSPFERHCLHSRHEACNRELYLHNGCRSFPSCECCSFFLCAFSKLTHWVVMTAESCIYRLLTIFTPECSFWT